MDLDFQGEPPGIEYPPQGLGLTDVNIQLFQEFQWYQLDQNIPTIYVNKDTPLNEKRVQQKEVLPSFNFQQLFTLDNCVLICKVVERRLLLSKRNIYHKNRARQPRAMASSFTNYSGHSDSDEYDLFLQFPTKLVRDLICIDFEKGNPFLLVPTQVGTIYIIRLKDMHIVKQRGIDIQVPSIDLDVSTIITQLVNCTPGSSAVEADGLLLAANCSNATVYFFQVSQFFEEQNRRVLLSYDIRLTRRIIDNIISNIIAKPNEKDSLATLQYISHGILVGVTKNNVIKVLNVHKRAVVLEYKIDFEEFQNERNDDGSEPCLRALSINPLIQNQKVNFLLAFCRLQSTIHRYVKLFNLSFRIEHQKRKIFNLSEIPSNKDLGAYCELSTMATYDTYNLITSLDLNAYGLVVSSYDDTDCNSEVHHFRFSKAKAEISSSLFSKATELHSFDERRSNLILSDIAPEDVCDIIANNPELIPTDSIIQAMRACELPFNTDIFRQKPLEKRAELLDGLRANWENGSLGDIAMLRFFQECFLKSKENAKMEGVFLSKDKDFPPVIMRNRMVSLAIKGDAVESLNLLHRQNVKKEMGAEVLNSLDLSNPHYFENFLVLLSYFKKSTGSYVTILQNYLEKDYENVTLMIEDILAEIEPDFKSENQTKFLQLLSDLVDSGGELVNWCDQLRQLLVNALDIDKESEADNVHLVDNIDIWGFGTVDLICSISRQRVKHYLEFCLDVALMIQYINSNPAASSIQTVDRWALRTIEDYIQSMMSFLILMNYSPDLNNLNRIEHKEIAEVISNFNHIDTFTYFVVFEYRKYLGNATAYDFFEPQNWFNKVCSKLIRKINFEPRYERVDEVPDIVSFLIRSKEYETALVVIDKMFYKNPALEYAKTECLYHLNRLSGIDMMSSMFFVASYVNKEGLDKKSRAPIQSCYWHNKNGDYLKSITERITASLSSPLANFLLDTMRYGFCQSQNIAAGIANAALYLKDIDNNSLILFLKEIIEVSLKTESYDLIYNYLYIFPRHTPDSIREYTKVFKNLINELISKNQVKRLIEFPLDMESYKFVAMYLEEYLREECEKMIQDFKTTLHKPEDIFNKFEKSYTVYHRVISFFLEKELYKQAGLIMLSYYESLTVLDYSFKSLEKPAYLRVLRARMNLIVEAISCLDVSEDQYGYIIQKPKENAKQKSKRNHAAFASSTMGLNKKKDTELGFNAFGLEEPTENNPGEEDFLVLNKTSLFKYQELLSARVALEERDGIQLSEADCLLPDNIIKIGRYLVALGEIDKSALDKAVSFCTAFQFAIQDVVQFLVYLYYSESTIEGSKVNECLWKIMSSNESYKGVYVRSVIAEAILRYSEEKYGYPIALPAFLVDEFREKDPIQLTRIYLDFELYEEAVKTLVYVIQENKQLMNQREMGINDSIDSQVRYIDPNIFEQRYNDLLCKVVGLLDELKRRGEQKNVEYKLDELFRAVKGAVDT